MRLSGTSPAGAIPIAVLVATGTGACGGNIELGSDVLWTAGFETGKLDEWTSAPGGVVTVMPSPPGSIAVSVEHAHGGKFAAALVVDAEPGSGRQVAVLSRPGGLPAAAYYSAWYYLPRTIQVGMFWTIFKFRSRSVADDPSTVGELFDVDLVNDAAGEMTLQVFDFQTYAAVPLRVGGLVVPVGAWFQIEAYYRNASDATGALTVWFNGQEIVDLEGIATSPTPWVEWEVASVAQDLTPAAATLFVDDCAITRRRVGPGGRIIE